MARTVNIVFSSTGVGGVEKRLVGLFLHLVTSGRDVRLVAPRELVDALAATADCSSLTRHEASIDTFIGGSDAHASLRRRLRTLRRKNPDDIWHYVLASPLRLHRGSSKRTLYTIPNASLAQYNARGLVEVYGGIVRSARVDVLDPQVFRELSGRFWWRRNRFHLTPGSYVDLDAYQPAPPEQKRNTIAFTGLFSDEKQAPRLVKCLPELLRRLDEAKVHDVQIVMMGRDAPGGVSVTKCVTQLCDPRLRAYFEPAPARVLARAKIFLSLQRTTNHPSKALLEAMACGCTPVVTDTRDSRLSAPDHLARYVPRDFTAADLASACTELFRRSDDEARVEAQKLRAFLSTRFSLRAMARHYLELYAALSKW